MVADDRIGVRQSLESHGLRGGSGGLVPRRAGREPSPATTYPMGSPAMPCRHRSVLARMIFFFSGLPPPGRGAIPIEARLGVVGDDLARLRRIVLPVHRHSGAVGPRSVISISMGEKISPRSRAKLRVLERCRRFRTCGSSGARTNEATPRAASLISRSRA